MGGSEHGPHFGGGDVPAGSPHDFDSSAARPNPAQRRYLVRGLHQPGGKLPLFDEVGRHVHPALIRACIAHGWAEPWFGNPMKPDWLVCKLTPKGRCVAEE
jgi:hypothetical protein